MMELEELELPECSGITGSINGEAFTISVCPILNRIDFSDCGDIALTLPFLPNLSTLKLRELFGV